MAGPIANRKDAPWTGPWADWSAGLAYLRDAPRTLLRLADRGPEPQALRVGALRLLLVHRPEDLVGLLARDRQGWAKAGLGRAEALIGQGLLTSAGEHHDRQRLLVQHAFMPERLTSLRASWIAAAEGLLARWESRPGEHGVFGDLKYLSARCIAEALFGPLDAAAQAALEADLATCMAWLNRYPEPLAFLDQLPSPGRRAMRAARTRLRARARGAWQSDGGGPLLAPLRSARDGAGRAMDEEAAVDELLTFLIAAFEPTAVALSWTLWRLARHPDWQERLVAEARLERAVDEPGDLAVTAAKNSASGMAAAPKLSPLRHAFLAECLRLHPPIWVVARRAPQACTVGGRAVSAGTWLMLSPLVTQRGPAYHDPRSFQPERWAAGEPPPGAYLPFGWGLRRCLGEGLALGLCDLFLDLALQRLRLELPHQPGRTAAAASSPPPMEATITLRPKAGLPLHITAR